MPDGMAAGRRRRVGSRVSPVRPRCLGSGILPNDAPVAAMAALAKRGGGSEAPAAAARGYFTPCIQRFSSGTSASATRPPRKPILAENTNSLS